MNYKLIIKAVSVLSAAALFCIGCVDEDDGEDISKYVTAKIGTQRWMVENLNFDVNGSVPDREGRLYDWNTALKACPNGWHLPNFSEWMTLIEYAGGSSYKLKDLGFYRDLNGVKNWWSSTETSDSTASACRLSYSLGLLFMYESAEKQEMMTVRCVQNGGEYDTYYTLNIDGTVCRQENVSCPGWVSPTAGKHIYKAGTSVTVTASGNADWSYAFSHWTGSSSSTDSSITVIMDGNKTLTPNFRDTDWKPMGFDL